MAMPDQGQREIHDALRKTAGIHQLAGQHEERDGQQNEAIRAIEHLLRDHLCIEAG